MYLTNMFKACQQHFPDQANFHGKMGHLNGKMCQFDGKKGHFDGKLANFDDFQVFE